MPTSVMIQSTCLNLVRQAEVRARDQVATAHDQAERLLDLIQHMFLEALPALVFAKCSNLGTLDVSLKAYLALLQWVRDLGAQSFPVGGETISVPRPDVGELLLPTEIINAAVGRFMTPEAISTALVEALRRHLPNDPGRAGIVRDNLLPIVHSLVREQATQAIKDAQGTHVVANLRDLPAEDWAKILRDLLGKGLEEDSPIPRLVCEIINSNKEGWTRVLSGVARGAPEPVSQVGVQVVEAALPLVLQSKMGVQSLCATLNNSDNLQQVSAALHTFIGEHADAFLQNTLARPGGSEPLKQIIDDHVVRSVNEYVLSIAATTKTQAEWCVVKDAKAWQERFRKEIKDEIIAELDASPSGGIAPGENVEERLSELEKSISDEKSTWKSDLAENILTQVRETMRHRSPSTAGIARPSPLAAPLAPQRQKHSSGSTGRAPAAPGNKHSGAHSPDEGVTPSRKKSRDEDIIALDTGDNLVFEGYTPAPPIGRSTPRPAAGESGDTRRVVARGSSHSGSSSAPRRNPPRLSTTERELMVKSEWCEPLEDDDFVDAAAGADDLRGDPHYEQDDGLPEESREGSKGEGSSSSDDEAEETSAPRAPPLSHIWSTHDSWRIRLDGLKEAQKLDLDSEKEILRASGSAPSGYESEEVLTVAALSRLGDYVPNRKFRKDWASRGAAERESLARPLDFTGAAAIGFTWLASVHWSEVRHPLILPIKVTSEEIYARCKYAVHLRSSSCSRRKTRKP